MRRPPPRTQVAPPDTLDQSALEAREQDRAELRLFWRQLGIVVLIAAIVLLRAVLL